VLPAAYCYIALSHITFFFFFVRALRQLDPDFTDVTIERAKACTVQCIFDLYRDGLDKVADPDMKKQRGNDTVETAAVPDDDQDDFLSNLLKSLPVVQTEVASNQDTAMTREQKFKTRVEAEMREYMAYCDRASWSDAIEIYPSEKYNKEAVKVNRIGVNPLYAASLFDIMGWMKHTCKE
jgi:hypothetical protein